MTSPAESSPAAAEAAWLDAMLGTDQAALRELIAPDAVIVHGPLGTIHGRADFLAGAARVGVVIGVSTSEVTVQLLGSVGIVSCLQESRIALVADQPPFVIQAVVSRAWTRVDTEGIGWVLAHMQMARRHPPS